MSFPPPMPIFITPLMTDQGIELLRNFEDDPDKLVYSWRFKDLIVDYAVADYDTNPDSRRIIYYCLEVNPDPGYIQMLLASSAKKNVTSLIEKLIAMFDLSLLDDRNDPFDSDGKSFTKAIIKSGNYHIAKDLILRGFLLDSGEDWFKNICKNPNFNHLAVVIDFIDFMIVTTGMLDVNQIVWGYPLVDLIMAGMIIGNEDEVAFRRAVFEHLLSLGADPKAKDRMRQNEF